MAEKEMKNPEVQEEEIVKPIILRIPKRNEVFTLEFSRESIKFAERNGFVIDDVDKMPMSGLIDLFYYSFRMHHMRVSREQAERILFNDMKGFPEGMVERLGKLYGIPMKTLSQTEEDAKNSEVTVEM